VLAEGRIETGTSADVSQEPGWEGPHRPSPIGC